jgi:mono/diheme cytochrome c family protein
MTPCLNTLVYGFRLAIGLSAAVLAARARTPDFTQDIAPIVSRACAPCHRPGEAAPFPLLTYADVKKRAAVIAAVTQSRYMPPWLPEKGYGDFEGERRLTEAEIRAISDWVSAGAPEGPPSRPIETASLPSGWPLGNPDLVLDAPAAFQVPAGGRDLLRR